MKKSNFNAKNTVPRSQLKSQHFYKPVYNLIKPHLLQVDNSYSYLDSNNICHQNEDTQSKKQQKQKNIFKQSLQNIDQNMNKRILNDLKIVKKYEVVGYKQYNSYIQRIEKLQKSLKYSGRRTGLMHSKNSIIRPFRQRISYENQSTYNQNTKQIDKYNLCMIFDDDNRHQINETMIKIQNQKKIELQKSISQRKIVSKIDNKPKLKNKNRYNIYSKRFKTIGEQKLTHKIDAHRKHIQKKLERTITESKQNILPEFWVKNLRASVSLKQFYDSKTYDKIDHSPAIKLQGKNKKIKEIQWIKNSTSKRFAAIDSSKFQTLLVKQCQIINQSTKLGDQNLKRSKSRINNARFSNQANYLYRDE